MLRYLRCHRKVLHRDISKGNVLFMGGMTATPSDTGAGAQNTERKDVPLCFIKYLLKERYVLNRLRTELLTQDEYSTDPQQTSALLIDFNHAEILGEKEGAEYKRTTRTVSCLLSLFYEPP